MSRQNNIEHVRDMIDQGKMTVMEGNVQLILDQRFRLIKNSIPRDIRKALNEAVKKGILGHKKKDGHKPECYYHPTFEYLANAARNADKLGIHRDTYSKWERGVQKMPAIGATAIRWLVNGKVD